MKELKNEELRKMIVIKKDQPFLAPKQVELRVEFKPSPKDSVSIFICHICKKLFVTS